MTARPRQAGTAAFDAFYENHYASMVRLARLLTGSIPLAEDLTQDAFVRIAGRLDQVDNPAAYLRTSVVNACRSHHRREDVARRHLPPLPELELPSYLAELNDALSELPEQQRAAVVLRYYLDLPDVEIAATLGCSRSNVRSLVRRAMAKLREVIEQ